MQYTYEQLYQHLYEKANNVYNIFKNFFGEDRVDLQDSEVTGVLLLYSFGIAKDSEDAYDITEDKMRQIESRNNERRMHIYVWWPRVRVTNEYGKSVIIQDLYAKVEIQCDGTIPYESRGFRLNRATYPLSQFNSNYMHSHIESIPKHNFTLFMIPCLGTGPIINTIGTLKNENDEITWMLFCEELDRYVTVESITGGPYHRLESIGGNRRLISHIDYGWSMTFSTTPFLTLFNTTTLRKFIVYYLKNGHLSLNYKYEKFTPGMSYYDYIMDLSNSFISFYNDNLKNTGITLATCIADGLLYKTIVNNGIFYIAETSNDTIDSTIEKYSNKPVLTFKGKEILTTIINDIETHESSTAIIISNYVAMWILRNILGTINYRYENEYYNKRDGIKPSSSSGRRVIYI